MPDATPLQTATEARDAAVSLAQVEWDDASGPELTAAAVALAEIKHRVEAALVAVAEQLESPRGDDALSAAGWASARDFLTRVTGGHKGAGGGLVRLAQQTADLPDVRAAHARGALSTDQARTIAGRVSTLPRDPGLRERVARAMIDLVAKKGHDATDLRRSFTGLARELDTDGLLADDLDRDKAERGAHHQRHLTVNPDGLGGAWLRGYGTLEDAELIKTCLQPLAAPETTAPGACGGTPRKAGDLGRDADGRRVNRGCPDPQCAHDGSDPREGATRLWDALLEACRRLQATDSLPHAHGTAARITVVIDHDDLRDQVDDAGLLGSGERLSAAAVRRLACDAEIIPGVLGSDGQVLDVGRLQRLVTTAIWLALVLRDRHCTFPGCDRQPIACDAHHIVHWADGGPTSLDNLVLLCRRHHTLTHHSPWTVHLDPVTRRPVWTPPPPVDDRHRFTYLPARPPPDAA